MEKIKTEKNISLVLGMSIPVLMILIVAGTVYIPRIFVNPPRYNFLYVSGLDYGANIQYSVEKGKLVKTEIKNTDGEIKNFYPPQVQQKLFIYDFNKNESKEISFEDAVNLNLDSNIKSPDGFEITNGSDAQSLFFDARNFNVFYLKGHNIRKKIDLQLSGYYPYNFRFLGWVK